MSRHSLETKVEFIKYVTEKHYSANHAAKTLNVGRELARQWLKLYELHGLDGLIKRQRTFSGEFKIHIIEYMHDNHLSEAETSQIFGIANHTTVGKWELIYYEEGPQALYRDNRGRKKSMSSDKPKKKNIDKQTEEDLIAEVQRLRMENAYLKKLRALVQKRIDRENGNGQPPSTS